MYASVSACIRRCSAAMWSSVESCSDLNRLTLRQGHLPLLPLSFQGQLMEHVRERFSMHQAMFRCHVEQCRIVLRSESAHFAPGTPAALAAFLPRAIDGACTRAFQHASGDVPLPCGAVSNRAPI